MNQRRFTRSQVSKYSAMKKAMQISFTRRAVRFTYDIYTRLLTRANIFLRATITKNPIQRPFAKQNHHATRTPFSWILKFCKFCKTYYPVNDVLKFREISCEASDFETWFISCLCLTKYSSKNRKYD